MNNFKFVFFLLDEEQFQYYIVSTPATAFVDRTSSFGIISQAKRTDGPFSATALELRTFRLRRPLIGQQTDQFRVTGQI